MFDAEQTAKVTGVQRIRMRHLFLHIETPSGRMEDPDGALFDSLTQARAEALTSLAEIVGSSLKSGQPVQGLRIDICDEPGQVLESVPVEEIFR
jgi:hypothetical protein